MAYTLRKTSGEVLLVLNDGVVDTAATSISLIAKDVVNFGDYQNENFIHMLENFSNTTQPPSPLTGQFWFNTKPEVNRPVVYDGVNWRSIAVLHYSSTITDTLINAGAIDFAASSPGDLWFNSVSKQLFVVSDTNNELTLIGPDGISGFGVTKARPVTVTDTFNLKKPVIQLVVNDEVIGIISNTEFNGSVDTTNLGFPKVNKGLTFKNSNDTVVSSTIIHTSNITSGSTSTTGLLSGQWQLVDGSSITPNNDILANLGSASLRFDNVFSRVGTFNRLFDSAARVITTSTISGTNNQVSIVKSSDSVRISLPQDIATTSTPTFSKLTLTDALNGGVAIGDTPPVNVTGGTLWWDSSYNNLRIFYPNSDGGVWVDAASGIKGEPGTFTGTTELPLATSNTSPTVSTSTGALIIAGGAGIGQDLFLGGRLVTTQITSGTPVTTGTITGSCTLTAGSTLQATYADLAEYYLSDAIYEPGTVLVFGGAQEVTTTSNEYDTKVAGVVTTNPAYILNSALEGRTACIALQGRVPVKVIGTVSKGDILVTSSTPGYAEKAQIIMAGTIIGKSVQNKSSAEPGIVEVSVGRT